MCLKCLNKEPSRRYVSALALADDLQRYLAGEPVRARPIGAVSRAARWARRRPAIASLLAVCRRRHRGFRGGDLGGPEGTNGPGECREGTEGRGSTQRTLAEAAREREAAQRRRTRVFQRFCFATAPCATAKRETSAVACSGWRRASSGFPIDDLDLKRAIRTNLAGWQWQVHPLVAMLGHSSRVSCRDGARTDEWS